MPTSRIKCSVAYDSYIYGEHAFPIISVTHTRYDKDPIDIPKESKDPPNLTSQGKENKQKYISWITRIAKVWGWHHRLNSRDNGYQSHYSPNWQGDIIKPCHLLVWLALAMSSVPLQDPGICHMYANPSQKTCIRNNVKNIALITSMVIRRIKDRYGQVISVRYPNKENHDRQKDETDSNGMMIFAWPPGSG